MIERIVAILIALSAVELLKACDAPGHVGPTLVIPAEAVARLDRKLDPLGKRSTVILPRSLFTVPQGPALELSLPQPILTSEPMPQRFVPNSPQDLGLYHFEWQNMTPYLKSFRGKR